jgi:hypothetical protein
MGLFGKKKQEDKTELPPLKFPELPQSVPTFEPNKGMQLNDARQIKSAISPRPIMPKMNTSSVSIGSEKPLFIKIDKYRDVVKTLDKLKSNLSDADNILSKLNQLKVEEDRELNAWNRDLEAIRNHLLDIDHKLFENA